MNTWEWIQEHGLLVTLLIGGVLVGIVFLKKQPQVAPASTASPADLSGLTTDASGNPIVYRAVSDTFITENISGSYNAATSAANAPASVGSTSVGSTTGSTTTTTDNHSAPIEHPIEPTPTPKTVTTGLLGPNVAVNFSKRTYKSPTSPLSLPIPIPSGDALIQGSFNRVWYMDGGVKHLLTSGVGGPIEAIP